MKRRALLQHLKKHGCEFFREGKKHTVYINKETGRSSTVPRHTEIADNMAKKICKDLGVSSP